MAKPRLHKSSIVLGILIALLLLLINVPGRVVDYLPGFSKTFEHGWPSVYLRRQTREPSRPSLKLTRVARRNAPAQLPAWGIPALSGENWAFWQSHIAFDSPRWHFSAINLMINIAMSLIVLFVFVAAWEFRRRRRPHLLSFTIADILIVTTAVSVLLGHLVYLNRGHLHEVQHNTKSPQSALWCEETCIAPTWLRSLIGERLMPAFMWRVDRVSASGLELTDASAIRNELARFPYLHTFELYGTIGGTGHFQYSSFRLLPQLKTFKISNGPRIDDQDVSELIQLTGLTTLVVSKSMVSSQDQIPRLQTALPNCKIIDSDDDW